MLARLELTHVPRGVSGAGAVNDLLATWLGVEVDAMRKYRDRGVGPWLADVLACRAGTHPANVWPEWRHWVPGDECLVALEDEILEEHEWRRRRADEAFAKLRAALA